jgi:peroxiredoxin
MIFSRSNWLILGLAVLAAAVGGYAEHRRQLPAPADTALLGQSVPALTLSDLAGQPHRLSDYRGRRVLLNLWASWCVPCRDEMPALTKAQAKFGEHGAIVVGIAMDEPARARAFLAAHPVNYPILLGRLDAPSTSRRLGNRDEVLPYSVLLDGHGRILATRRGTLDARQLEAWLAPAALP